MVGENIKPVHATGGELPLQDVVENSHVHAEKRRGAGGGCGEVGVLDAAQHKRK